MKWLISLGGVFIIMLTYMSNKTYYDQFSDKQRDIKRVVDECAVGASYYLDTANYSQGFYVYNDSDCLEHVKFILQENMGMRPDFTMPAGKYWTGPAVYYTAITDDLNTLRIYRNDTLLSSNPFVYGNDYTDPITGRVVEIVHPSIIVSVDFNVPLRVTRNFDGSHGMSISVYENKRNE